MDSTLAFGEDLVQSPEHKSAGTSSVNFDGLLKVPLRLHEDLSKGCGGQLWPAGMVLSKYMLRHMDVLKDCSVIELGAGGGLVGLALAMAMKSESPGMQMHITDQDAMYDLMKRNISLNKLEGSVSACIYDWGSPVPASLPRPDVILAADCVYFEPAFPLLQQTMLDLIGDGTVCYFCFKKRRRADMHFLKAIRKLFVVEQVADDPDKESYSRQSIFLFKISKK